MVDTFLPDLPAGGFNSENLSFHVKTLASDEFEGREPGTRGEERTVAYLIHQFEELGLHPGGNQEVWTQDVPLRRFTIDDLDLSFTVHDESQKLIHGEHIVVKTLLPVDHVSIENAPLVFVGYGVKAPERAWDDFKGVDLRGKIAVVLINDPDFERDEPGVFGGKELTYYGRWTYKYEEAARQGARGMLIIHETAPASYGWSTVANTGTAAQFDIVRDEPALAHTELEGWIQREIAVQLFKAAGLDFEAEKKRAQTAEFTPVILQNALFSANYKVDFREVTSHNVVAKIPGSIYSEETLIYSAHWDHLGIKSSGSDGDSIFHGALDNASGIAGLLELARLFVAGPPPQRSILFIATTAEEKGLFGAGYYAANPLYPLELTVANLNIDMLSTKGVTRDVSSMGNGKVQLQDEIEKIARMHGRYFVADPNLEAGYFFRGDHFPFAKAGVPAITFSSGEDMVKGGVEAGKEWLADFVKNRYHQTTDRWSADWDTSGQIADLHLLFDLGRDLANSHRWPGWSQDSEFKAIRDRSKHLRTV